MPLARLFRLPDHARGAPLQARAFAHRPEPPVAAGREDHKRRRLRRRLVRRRREPRLYRIDHPAWNDRNLRELAAGISSPLFLAHVRASTGTAVQQTNCHPFRHGRWLWMHNGLIRGLRARAPRARARGRCLALPVDRGHHRLGADVLPRAHVGARDRSARRGGAHGRLRRGDRPRPRHRAPDPDVARDLRRARPLGVPLLQRGRLALALLQHAHQGPAGKPIPTSRSSPRCRTRRASSSPSPSATSPGAWNEVPESHVGIIQPGDDELRPFTRTLVA